MTQSLIKTTATLLLAGRLRYSIPTGRGKALYLTFDDGPHPDQTPAVLDILAEHNTLASFFLSGTAAEKSPALVTRILAAGHSIGNHGYLHRRPAEIGRKAYLGGIDRTQLILENIAGEPLPRLFRPPFGTLSLATLPGIIGRGYRIIMWNHDSMDSFIHNDAQRLANTACQFTHLDSVILLCHDDQSQTVELLPHLLSFATAHDYPLKSLTSQSDR